MSSPASELAPVKLRWPDGYFTTADGTRLHYVAVGDGPPVLLLHGAGGSAVGSWFNNGIAPKLMETNQVFAIDSRGHGLSGGAQAQHNDQATDALAFMDFMGIEKAHIGGYSMGGGVTLRLMARAPERFLSASLQGVEIIETEEWRDRIPPDVDGVDPDEEVALAKIKARREARGEEVGNHFRGGLANAPPPERHAGQRIAPAAWRLAMIEGLDLTKIDFPVMAINGEFDRPRERTHRMWRELRDFTNLVLPGKSHLTAMMPGLIPQAYIDGYAAFIRRNNPQDAD